MKDTLIPHLPSPSTPVADRRPGCGIMRTKELSLPLTSYSTRRAGAAPHLGSTVELALDTKVAGKPAPGHACGRVCPVSCQLGSEWHGQGRDTLLPSFNSCQLWASRRDSPRVMRMRKLAVSLTSYNTRENRPCTSPGQQVRAGPVCRGWW